ncbi:MAG: CRISPR-associated endonuclease Cas2 [Desulfurococcales archaeon]|nr:CRISPR-associated endonuclease Cas2 [Desulfurococcales archaeon]
MIIVAYDISDNERRLRMMRALLTLGYSRVQRSVYIHRRGFEAVRKSTIERASRIIDPVTDSIIILPVPDNVYRGMVKLGKGGWEHGIVTL